MRYRDHGYVGRGGSEFGAFLAGLTLATLVGGYVFFGPNAKRNRKKVEAWMLRAKAEIMERTEGVRDMTQDEYHKIVDEISEKYGEYKEVGKEKAHKFADEIKKRWVSIKNEAKKREQEMIDESEDGDAKEEWNSS